MKWSTKRRLKKAAKAYASWKGLKATGGLGKLALGAAASWGAWKFIQSRRQGAQPA